MGEKENTKRTMLFVYLELLIETRHQGFAEASGIRELVPFVQRYKMNRGDEG